MEVRKVVFCLVLVMVRTNADENSEKLVNSVNNFSLKLYKELTKTEENIFCSGYSFSVALNMLLVGARGNTASEIKSVLNYDSLNLSQENIENSLHSLLTEQRANHTGYEFTIANSVWIHNGYHVLEDFKSTIRDKFYGEEKEVAFGTAEATNAINEWVDKQTQGKIRQLFDEVLDGLTRTVLVNAMYFKGTWQTKFKKELTSDYPFQYSENNQAVERDVKMMYVLNEFPYAESSELKSQVVELPYNGDEVSMVILLPFRNSNLEEVEQELDVNKLGAVLNKLSETKVHLRIPKFKASSTFNLNEILNSLGIKDAFVPDKADLSGIDGTNDLYVSTTVQKAVVEVNEEGTVAAAASGVAVGIRTLTVNPIVDFVADRPFIYIILHKPTGIAYFTGRFFKP